MPLTKPGKRVSAAGKLDSQIRTTCRILESVAKSQPPRSPQRAAIRRAAEAFIYLRLHKGLSRGYQAWQKNRTKPLIEDQKRSLHQMGIPV